jgi:ubiquinone/menaquinone biosynthesis C-methylase UbiE
MTFSNNIKNNNIFTLLLKNKNMLEHSVNLIHKLTGIEKEQIIIILHDKQNCKDGSDCKGDRSIYNALHKLYWHKGTDVHVGGSSWIVKRAQKNALKIKSVIPKNINIYNKDVFIDIGCGDGSITHEFAKLYKFKKVICVDVENWFDTYTEKNKEISMVITDGHTINIKSNNVDVILCNHVLHHVVHLDDMLNEIARIIKKGGILIIKEHNCYYTELSYLIDIYHTIYELVLKKVPNPKFINEYYSLYLSDNELYNKLKRLGFEIVNYVYEGNMIGNYYALYTYGISSTFNKGIKSN